MAQGGWNLDIETRCTQEVVDAGEVRILQQQKRKKWWRGQWGKSTYDAKWMHEIEGRRGGRESSILKQDERKKLLRDMPHLPFVPPSQVSHILRMNVAICAIWGHPLVSDKPNVYQLPCCQRTGWRRSGPGLTWWVRPWFLQASCSEQKERMIDTSAIYIYRVYYRYMYICIHVYKLLIIYQNNSAA